MSLERICSQLLSAESESNEEIAERGRECLRLVACEDGDLQMENFLQRLRQSECVRTIVLTTDFITSLTEENAALFVNCLGNVPNLKDLYLQSSSRFHVETIPSLLSLQSATKLQTLSMEDIQVTAAHKEFVADLGQALKNHSSLTFVKLSNFFANDWSNTEPDVLEPLVEALGTIPNLETLYFSGCGSHALTGQDVRLISPEGISQLMGPCLKLLELSFLELQDEHFETIARQLSKNSTLETISLDYHRLGSKGFRDMMRALETNSGVRTLSLRSLHDIGEEGYAQAMKMLQFNYGIEVLSVTANPLQQANIDLYLRMNSAGRAKLRDPTASTRDWVNVLARTSDDVDVVRHLLQEMPGLCNTEATIADDPATDTTAPIAA